MKENSGNGSREEVRPFQTQRPVAAKAPATQSPYATLPMVNSPGHHLYPGMPAQPFYWGMWAQRPMGFLPGMPYGPAAPSGFEGMPPPGMMQWPMPPTMGPGHGDPTQQYATYPPSAYHMGGKDSAAMAAQLASLPSFRSVESQLLSRGKRAFEEEQGSGGGHGHATKRGRSSGGDTTESTSGRGDDDVAGGARGQNEPKEYACTWENCGRIFGRKSVLNFHIRTVHLGTRDFKCSVKGCKKEFGQKSDLTRHIMTVHEKRKEFKCPYDGCTWEFGQKGNMMRHISSVHRGEKKKDVGS